MKLDIFIPLVTSALIAIVGWYVAYLAAIRRDRMQKRRDLTVQYLIEAYRRVEKAALNELKGPASSDLESAIADIQLFGSADQVKHAQEFARNHAATGQASANSLLVTLRRDLRKELNLERVSDSLLFYRTVESKTPKEAKNTACLNT